MRLEWGELISGSEIPVGVGISAPVRCAIRVGGRPTAAILKRIPPANVLSEAFCAILLDGWGLRVPQPYLVSEPGRISFASGDLGYPNLAQRFGVLEFAEGSPERRAAELVACQHVCSFETVSLAAAADEAVGNRDRNLGNLLWDGGEPAWIDHAYSLGNHDRQPDVNKLCAIAIRAGKAEEIERASIARWMAMDRDLVSSVEAAASVVGDSASAAAFVAARLQDLGMRLLARFPKRADLLSPP